MADMSEHILLIDDDLRLTDMVSGYLRQNGYTVDAAGSGPMGFFSWVRIDQRNLSIVGNTVDGTQGTYPAIWVKAQGSSTPNLDGLVIRNNRVTADAGSGWQLTVSEVTTGTVTGVDVADNSFGSFRNLTSSAIDLSGNWWGQSTGPAAGQTGGTVTTAPWITGYTDWPCTLTHGDFRLDNMFYDADGAMTLIDWQLSMRAPSTPSLPR